MCYGNTVFEETMYKRPFVIVFLLAALALVGIAGWGQYWYTWIVFLAFFFALWVASLVVMGRHRRNRSSFSEGSITSNGFEGQMVQLPVTTTHKQLDMVRGFLTQMIVLLVVLTSLMLIKCVFLLVIGGTGRPSDDYHMVFYQVFCIVPDLALTVWLMTSGTMDLFALEQYEPIGSNARDEEAAGDTSKASGLRDSRDEVVASDSSA